MTTARRPGCRPAGKLKHAPHLQTPAICGISFSLSRRAKLAHARRAMKTPSRPRLGNCFPILVARFPILTVRLPSRARKQAVPFHVTAPSRSRLGKNMRRQEADVGVGRGPGGPPHHGR
jgi:hypothetical protein